MKKTLPISSHAFEERQDTSVFWLGGAGFLLNVRGTIVLIDPVLTTISERPLISEIGLPMKIPYPIRAEEIPKADVVLYTHSDSDHLGRRTAVILSKLKPRCIGPPPVFECLAREDIDVDLIEICRPGDAITINQNLHIQVTPADHPWQLSDPEKNGKPFRYGDCCGFIVESPDARCFFPGDTRLMEEHLAIRDIDILALDVSLDPYHLGPRGAAVIANTLIDALLIPMHYGTYDAPDKPAHTGAPTTVFAQIRDSNRRGRILAPGEPLIMRDHREISSYLQ